jgi:hypothetical protein
MKYTLRRASQGSAFLGDCGMTCDRVVEYEALWEVAVASGCGGSSLLGAETRHVVRRSRGSSRLLIIDTQITDSCVQIMIGNACKARQEAK